MGAGSNRAQADHDGRRDRNPPATHRIPHQRADSWYVACAWDVALVLMFCLPGVTTQHLSPSLSDDTSRIRWKWRTTLMLKLLSAKMTLVDTCTSWRRYVFTHDAIAGRSRSITHGTCAYASGLRHHHPTVDPRFRAHRAVPARTRLLLWRGGCSVGVGTMGEHSPDVARTQMALLTDRPRTASVSAVGEARLLSLNRTTLRRILGPFSDILKRDKGLYNAFMAQKL